MGIGTELANQYDVPSFSSVRDVGDFTTKTYLVVVKAKDYKGHCEGADYNSDGNDYQQNNDNQQNNDTTMKPRTEVPQWRVRGWGDWARRNQGTCGAFCYAGKTKDGK